MFHNELGTFPIGNYAPNFPIGNYQATWPWSLNGGWWAFHARLLPYLESKNIFDLCQQGFTYQGDCFDWTAAQPPEMNPNVMILSQSKCPDDPLKDSIYPTSNPSQGSYGVASYFGVMGTTEFANDGILTHGGPNSAIRLRKSLTGPPTRSSWVNAD